MIRPFFPQPLMAALRQGLATAEAHPSMGQRRVVLMAIHGEAWPGDGALPHEIHSVPYPARPMYDYEEGQDDTATLPSAPSQSDTAYVVRPVRGEVVGDNHGRLFERVHGRVRLLDRIIRGPAGELLELVPAPRFSAKPLQTSDEVLDAEIEAETPSESARAAESEGPSCQRRGARALFVEPGLRRVVRLGEFRGLLATQLAHPEHLRESHQLPCFVQLLEATSPKAVEAFRAEIERADELRTEPLTKGAAQVLGLGPALARLPRVMRPARREPGSVLPGDRFFTLRIAEDPTEKTANTSTATEQASAVAVPAPGVAISNTQAALRRTIPEQFSKPWDFQFTREQALYEMNVASTFAGPLSRLWRGVKRLLAGRRGLRKWQAMLYSKSLDQQLWGVRPPGGSLDRPAVREWARRMLELAKYDPSEMLLEWEIFWRRKGV